MRALDRQKNELGELNVSFGISKLGEVSFRTSMVEKR